MRVLVTGHKGFIGSVMVPALLRDGIDVDGMDTDLYRECTVAGSLANVPEIERDIRDATPADLEGFDGYEGAGSWALSGRMWQAARGRNSRVLPPEWKSRTTSARGRSPRVT